MPKAPMMPYVPLRVLLPGYVVSRNPPTLLLSLMLQLLPNSLLLLLLLLLTTLLTSWLPMLWILLK